MITPPAIPGFTFSKEPYADLVTRYLALPGYTSELLGQSFLGHDIYGFAYGDMSMPTMYVEGNIHGGHEWRTCWWVSEFMRLLHDPTTLPVATRDAIADLKSRYSFYFIPSVNPDGYVNNTYQNGNGVSVSENFDYNWAAGGDRHTPGHAEYRGPFAWSEPESRVVRDKVLELEPVSLLCNHTWSSSTVGFTTRRPQNAADEPAILEFWDEVRAALGYDDTYVATLSSKLATGSAYNWAGTQTSSLGRPIIGHVWESGGGMTVEDQSRVGMTGILYHMLMVDDMLTAPEEPTPPPLISAAWGPVRIGGLNCPVSEVALYDGAGLRTIWLAES